LLRLLKGEKNHCSANYRSAGHWFFFLWKIQCHRADETWKIYRLSENCAVSRFQASFCQTVFLMMHTILLDNLSRASRSNDQDCIRDHPHRMGSGNPWPRQNTHTLYRETSFAAMHRLYSYI